MRKALSLFAVGDLVAAVDDLVAAVDDLVARISLGVRYLDVALTVAAEGLETRRLVFFSVPAPSATRSL